MVSVLARAAGVARVAGAAWRQVNSGINKKQAPVRRYINQFLGNLAMLPLNPQNRQLGNLGVLPLNPLNLQSRQYSKNSETINFDLIQRFFGEFNSLWRSIEVNRQIHSILDPNRDVELNEFNNKKDKLLKLVTITKQFFEKNTHLKLNETQKNTYLLKVLDFQFMVIPKIVKELGFRNVSLFEDKSFIDFYLKLWTLELPIELTNMMNIYESCMDKIHTDMLDKKNPLSLGFLLRNEGLMKWMAVHLENVTSLELQYLRESHSNDPEIVRVIDSNIKFGATLCVATVCASLGPEDTTDRLNDSVSAKKMYPFLNLEGNEIGLPVESELYSETIGVSLKPLFEYTRESTNIVRTLISNFFNDEELRKEAIKLVSTTLIHKSDTHMSTDRINAFQSASNYEAGLNTMMVEFFYAFFELVTKQTVIELREKYKKELDYNEGIFNDQSYIFLKRKNGELARLANDIAGYVREGRDECNPLGNEIWRIVDQHVNDAMGNNLSPKQNNTAQMAVDTTYNVLKTEFENPTFGSLNPNSAQLILRVTYELHQKLNRLYLEAAHKKFSNDPKVCRDLKLLESVKDSIRMNGIDWKLKQEIIRLTSIEQMLQRYINQLLQNSRAVSKCINNSFRLLAESDLILNKLNEYKRGDEQSWNKVIKYQRDAWSNILLTYLATTEEDGGK
jgi:hypothetical protein